MMGLKSTVPFAGINESDLPMEVGVASQPRPSPGKIDSSATERFHRPYDYSWVLNLQALVAILERDANAVRLAAASPGLLKHLPFTIEAYSMRVDELFDAGVNLSEKVGRAIDYGEPSTFPVLVGGNAGAWQAHLRPAASGEAYAVLELSAPESASPASERQLAALIHELNDASGSLASTRSPGEPLGEALRTWLGYAAAPSPRTLDQLVHPQDDGLRRVHEARLSKLENGEFATIVLRFKHRDRRWRWIELSERTLPSDPGGAARILTLAKDVSEPYRLQRSLAAACKALLQAESGERRRIARELHDSTAQHLAATEMTLSRLERRLVDGGDPAILLGDMRESVRAAQRDVRVISYLLHPPEIERRSLESTLRRFVGGFAARTGLAVRLTVQGRKTPLETVSRLALFRIAQEALMNAHKHSNARSVEVRLRYAAASVMLEVAERSSRQTRSRAPSRLGREDGIGIAAMTARMKQIGGTLEICPRASGYRVRACLPLDPSSPASGLELVSARKRRNQPLRV